MKTAYELAMERLNKSAPVVKLTAAQKRDLAELDSRCKAKIAETELNFDTRIKEAAAGGDGEKMAELRQQLGAEKRKLQESFDEKKERVRQGK